MIDIVEAHLLGQLGAIHGSLGLATTKGVAVHPCSSHSYATPWAFSQPLWSRIE